MLLRHFSIRPLRTGGASCFYRHCYLSIGLLLLCHWVSPAYAQLQADSIMATVEIQGLLYEPFTAGVKRQRLDSLSLQLQQGQTLAQVLQERSPLYIKEYGPGQLSTVSFRGTSANHTAVLWNGLNLNRPSLGETDFSQIPLFVVEGVQVQYGSSSALYGSDAMGGSIQLRTYPAWNLPGWGARVRQEAGSFGYLFSGIEGNLRRQSWQSSIKAYRSSADNDFSYINRYKKDKPREYNHHSSFWQQGLSWSGTMRPQKRGELSAQAWWHQAWRQVQPSMGNFSEQAQQLDDALRLNLQYLQLQARGSWQAQAGWLSDKLVYNGLPYRTRQLIVKAETDYQATEMLLLQAGGQWNWRVAISDAYTAEEQRAEVFMRALWELAPTLSATLHVRQALADFKPVPLTPALSMQWQLVPVLILKASAGRHYRLPTLNERFWPESGNPHILPEMGWNAEAGLVLQSLRFGKSVLSAELNYYHMWVNNWIVWIERRGRPTPVNLREVVSKGVEFQGQWERKAWRWRLQAGYTQAEDQNVRSITSGRQGAQLMYVPSWQAQSFLRWQPRQWLAELSTEFTDSRYTTNGEDPLNYLPAFYLFHVSAGRNWRWSDHHLTLFVRLKNIMNQQYEVYSRRAMPGRHVAVSLNYQINQSR